MKEHNRMKLTAIIVNRDISGGSSFATSILSLTLLSPYTHLDDLFSRKELIFLSLG
jgi:hypothetical protein